ncbi:hypothetical protein DM860_001164 [Cuscuta australis]|uniref:Uncharacterized protein n=1 Tax=Cuscuta australis TaxID=267555 RepID=A0A328DT71_9ASTE|nr:hypothetical protein DM860_001164 [Cuscuta australis]
MEEGEQIDLEIKDHSISNVSLENDNFVLNLSSSQLLQAISLNQPENQKEPICLELFENIEGQEELDTYPCDEKDDTFPEICETIEPESPKWKGNFKFRESLAWDSAFFTDAGVLEPEQLSRMIKRTENGDKHDLFGIDEDVELSTGSITYGSDDLNLWQLKIDSCEDIKASTKGSCKMSNLMISSSHVTSSKEVNEATSALNEVDYNKNKLVPKVSPKRTIGAQTSRVSKSQQKQFCAIQGSGKSVAETSSQLMQANTRTTDSKSFLGSSKRTSKVNSVSAAAGKGTTRDAKHFKMVHANGKLSTGSNNGTEAPKVALNNAHKVLLKPATSLRPPSIGSSAPTRNVSRSSSSSTASTLSDRTTKSTSSVARKVESKSVGRPAVNTPSQIPLKNDVSFRNSAVGAYVMSSKMSPGISPGSSLTSGSGWSSTSSTSRSINNFSRSNGSRTSLDTSRSVDSYSPASDLSNHPSQRHTSAKSVTRTALRSGSVSKPLRHNTLSQAASKKPSCLRMPSPKIGFFDADKSVCSPSGSMLSPPDPNVAVMKLGANIRANLKTKTTELPNAKTLNVSVSTECETEVPSQESRDGNLCPKHAAGDLIKSKTSTICLKH